MRKIRRLSEVAMIVGGGTPSTKNDNNFGGDIPWITPKDLTSYRFRYIERGERNITSEGLENSGARRLPAGTVLLSSRAPVGYVAIAANEITTNQGFKSLILKDANVPEFFYYLLKAYRGLLESHASGTTFPELSGKVLGEIELAIPDPPEQLAIAEILGTLDDKIDLNERTNATLDQLARALFKSWFVDFDPVRTKAEARQPSMMDAATAALFPDSFEDSALGPIPAGWKIVGLGDLLGVVETGSRPRGGVGKYRTGVPSVGAESISRVGEFVYSKTKFVPRAFFDSMRRGHVVDGDVLLYKDGGRPGEFEPHATLVGGGFPFDEFAINEHVYRLRGIDNVPQTYLYYYLESAGGREEMRRRGTGVAIPGLNSTAVRALNVLSPATTLLAAFDSVAGPLVDLILANSAESRTLTEMRDTLLPKLISGELRVGEAAREVAGSRVTSFNESVVEQAALEWFGGLGPHPDQSRRARAMTKFRSVVRFAIGGGWGAEAPKTGFDPVAVIRGTDFKHVRSGRWREIPRRYEPAKKLTRRLLHPGDLVLEIAGGSPGRALLIDDRTLHALGGNVIPASFCKRIEINTEVAEPRYVYYHLTEMYQSGRAGLYEHQSTISNFQYDFFLDTEEVRLPPLAEQRAIAEVLGALDDKIELNERMSTTLDELARALFKSWFVDFDPVRAKAEGRQPSMMDAATAAPFPDSFADSALGPIPAGWDLASVAEMCSEVTRGVTPRYQEGSGLWIINQKCNRGFTLDLSQLKELDPELPVPEGKYARRGDILINSLGEGTRGRVHLYSEREGRFAVDQHISICRPNAPAIGHYLYSVLADARGQERLEALTTGSTGMTMLNISRLRDFEVISPPAGLLARFSEPVGLWRSLISANRRESRTLADLRDTLLPKLISGELRVGEAAREVAGEGVEQAAAHEVYREVGDVDADPSPAEAVRGDGGGAATAERVEHDVALVRGGSDDPL